MGIEDLASPVDRNWTSISYAQPKLQFTKNIRPMMMKDSLVAKRYDATLLYVMDVVRMIRTVIAE